MGTRALHEHDAVERAPDEKLVSRVADMAFAAAGPASREHVANIA